jgi:hypothetical protein
MEAFPLRPKPAPECHGICVNSSVGSACSKPGAVAALKDARVEFTEVAISTSRHPRTCGTEGSDPLGVARRHGRNNDNGKYPKCPPYRLFSSLIARLMGLMLLAAGRP